MSNIPSSEEVQRIVDSTVKIQEPLEERARFAAKHVMEGAAVSVSIDGIKAMAEFINGPKISVSGPEVGSCPICGAPPGKCVASVHGYEPKKI